MDSDAGATGISTKDAVSIVGLLCGRLVDGERAGCGECARYCSSVNRGAAFQLRAGCRARVVLMYVLDTNTLIYFFKGAGQVAERLLVTPPKEIGVPAVVLYELETGIAKSNAPKKRLKQLEEIVSVVRLLSFGRDEAKIAAAVRAQLDQQGTPIGPYDLLIAGTALSYDGVLVTRNSSEFARVENLRLEDWYG